MIKLDIFVVCQNKEDYQIVDDGDIEYDIECVLCESLRESLGKDVEVTLKAVYESYDEAEKVNEFWRKIYKSVEQDSKE